MKHEDDDLDKKLRMFPRHKMSEDSKKSIHNTLMKTRASRTVRKNHRKTRWMVGMASVAALMLFVILGVSLYQNGLISNAEESDYSSEEAKSLDEFAGDDKEPPHRNGEDETETGEANQTDNGEGENNAGNSDHNTSDADEPDNNNDTDAEEEADVQEVSDKIITALDERDMDTVAEYVDPEKGLTFSPYVYVTDDAVRFDKEDVPSMLDSDEAFVWGDYDGKGDPIELTPADYFDEFIDMEPYLEPDDVLVDDPQDRGNTKNNIKDVFPNTTVIEYYNDGSDEYGGIDWQSVDLVYDENDTGELQLVAIVRDMWTI